MAFRSDGLREAVLKEKKGSIANTSAFSGIASEFASASDPGGHSSSSATSTTPSRSGPTPARTASRPSSPTTSPRSLAGPLYAVMRKIYDAVWKWEARDSPDPAPFSGRSLFIAAERFKRMILRGLDYLPPGEVSFADYGRAILASDQASYPDESEGEPRDWIRREFVDRGIVESAKELEVETNVVSKAIAGLDLDTLASSDWAAYAFANRNRALLKIPPRISFHVRPRLDVTKLYYVRDDGADASEAGKGYRKSRVRELILKVKWDVQEPSGLGRGFPSRRKVTHGTTLAIDLGSKDHPGEAHQRRDRGASRGPRRVPPPPRCPGRPEV